MIPTGFIEGKDIKGPLIHILQDRVGRKNVLVHSHPSSYQASHFRVSLHPSPGTSQSKILKPFPLSDFYQPGRSTWHLLTKY